MITASKDREDTYLPTQEEIEAHCKVFRANREEAKHRKYARLDAEQRRSVQQQRIKRREERKLAAAHRRSLPHKKRNLARLEDEGVVMREMSKEDICNVESVPLDDMLDVLRMVTEAANDQMDALESDDARWTVVDGSEVG